MHGALELQRTGSDAGESWGEQRDLGRVEHVQQEPVLALPPHPVKLG